MRSRSAPLLGVALLIAAFGGVPAAGSPGLQVEPGAPEVRIVEPVRDSSLAVGRAVRVLVLGITPQQVTRAHAVLSARPQGASGDGIALFRCNSQSWVPLELAGACGLSWVYNPTTREGTLHVPWNAALELRGSYSIRVEVMLRYADRSDVWGLWARSEWTPVVLSPGALPTAPLLRLPSEAALFPLRQEVPIEVDLRQAGLFRWLRVEVAGLHAPAQVSLLWEGEVSGTTLRTVWNTGIPLPGGRAVGEGPYELVVVGVTGAGVAVRSEPRRIWLGGAPSIRMRIDGAEAVPGAVVTATLGRSLQFCADDGGRQAFKSYRWSFGDGGQWGEQCTGYVFRRSGTYTVSLTAFTEPGHKGADSTASVTVVVKDVSARINVTREILGFPDPCAGRMTVLPGRGVYVRLRMEVGEGVVALSAHEVLPQAWQVQDETGRDQVAVEVLRMIVKRDAAPDKDGVISTAYSWVVGPHGDSSSIPAGTRVDITYFLTPPGDRPRTADAALKFRGSVRATCRDGEVLDYPVTSGWTSVAVVERVAIPVLVAHLEGGTLQPLTFAKSESERYVISPQQFEDAKRLIGQDVVLPGHVLTSDEMERVIFYYKGRHPVSECITMPSR